MRKNLDKSNVTFVVLTLVLSVFLLLWATPHAQARQSEQTHIKETVRILQKEAVQKREHAADKRKKAERYATMAEDAKKQIAKLTSPLDKESWQRSYDTYHANAKEYLEVAADLEAKAAAVDAEIQKLGGELGELTQEVEREAVQEDERKEAYKQKRAEEALQESMVAMRPKLQSLLGVWKLGGTEDEPLVIAQKNPNSQAYGNELEVHTNNRVWKGSYYKTATDGNSMIELAYKPLADEMNPEIPEWARDAIDGQLEWTMEIDPSGTCGSPSLSASFYPGKVRWKEDGEGADDVWIEGKGKARTVALTSTFADVRAYNYGAPQLILRLPGTFNYVSNDVIDGLTKLQKFYIDVILPPQMARKQGETLNVTIKNLANGDDTSVELKRGAQRMGRSVTYTHYDAITIADRGDSRTEDRDPPYLSVNYILNNSGARLDLSADNGELIEFRYKDASQSVPVYNSWVQRKIARHTDAKDRLRIVSNAIVSDPNAPNQARENATQRVNMIKNYEAIFASPEIHDFMRYKLGYTYFESSGGLANMSREQMAHIRDRIGDDDIGSGRLSTEQMKGKNARFDKKGVFKKVLWVDRYERDVVRKSMNQARSDYRDEALNTIPKAIAYGLYSGIAASTGAGDNYTMWYGKDIFGKKVQGWQRVMAGVSTVSGSILSYSAPALKLHDAVQKRLFSPGHVGSRNVHFGSSGKITIMPRPTNIKARSIASNKLPSSLSRSQKNFAKMDADADAGGLSTKPIACARKAPPQAAGKGAAADGPPPHPGPLDPDTPALAAAYGVGTRPLRPGAEPILPPQEFGTCQCGATMLSVKESTGTAFSEMTVFGALVKKGVVRPGGDLPLTKGYTDVQLVAWLESVGAEVQVLHIAKTGKRLSLEALDAWHKRGWRVRDTLAPKTAARGGEHAVEFRGVERNTNGDITDVMWFDSAYGKEVITTDCNYLSVATSGHDVIMWRFNESPTANVSAKPTIIPPKKTAQPTIVYPKKSTEKRLTAKRNDESNIYEINSLDDLDGLDDAPPSVADIRDVINGQYPNGDAPPIHITDSVHMNGITRAGYLSNPKAGGASFSEAGVGAARAGNHAIRIKSEAIDHFVELRQHPAGLVHIYWPSGKKGVGEYKTYVPNSYLQRLDPTTGEWHDFPHVDITPPTRQGRVTLEGE